MLINEGKYKAASKLVWGWMTYNALFSGNSRDHFSGSERTENYEDVWYDKRHFDNIFNKRDHTHEWFINGPNSYDGRS